MQPPVGWGIWDRSPSGKWTTVLAGYAVISAILLGGNPANRASGLAIVGVVILMTAENKALHRDQIKRDAEFNLLLQRLVRLPQLVAKEVDLKEEKLALVDRGVPADAEAVVALDKQIAATQKAIVEITTTTTAAPLSRALRASGADGTIGWSDDALPAPPHPPKST